MNEPRRIVIGPLLSGDVMFVGHEDPIAARIAEANAKLDADRAERERLARQRVSVDREFFDQIVYELERTLDVERRWHARRRDFYQRDVVAGKIRYLHEKVAQTLAAKVTP